MKWRFVVPVISVLVCACPAKVEQPAAKPAPHEVAAPNDPCRWLSAYDATQALGQRVVRTNSPAPTYCKYGAPAKADNGSALAIVFTVDNDIASYTKFVQRDDAAAIAGLGDRAVWNTNGATVIVVKGDRRASVTIMDDMNPSPFSESELQQKAVAAAQKIVEKM